MSGIIIQALADYQPNVFLDCLSLAEALGICPRTIRRMVLRHELPQGIRQGKRKIWRVGAILDWFLQLEQENAMKAERGRERIRRYEEGV